jgi:hypothetical protein
MTRFLFRLLRTSRNIRAVRRGRIAQRVWNRGVSKVGWRILRRLYR